MIEDQVAAPVFNPNKVNEVPPERLPFPLRFSRETFSAPGVAEVTESERTPEGYLEIEWQYREVVRSLALDFDRFADTAYDRVELEQRAEPAVEKVNEQRAQLEIPVEPIHITEFSDRWLRHLIQPKWQEHIPTADDPHGEEKWERFKAQYPENMQVNLEELRELDGKMRVLSQDEALRSEIQSLHAERVMVMHAASAFLGADRKVDALNRRISELYRAAGASNRSLTTAEQRHIDRLQSQQQQIKAEQGREITSPDMLEEVRTELKRRLNIQRRRDFERGLVRTDSMKQIIDYLLPSLVKGSPALFLGETGGAKTALAVRIARQYFGVEPEFIAGNEETNNYQLMGKTGLKRDERNLDWKEVEKALSEEGLDPEKLSPEIRAQLKLLGMVLVKVGGSATVSEYMPGPAIRAMEDGRPLILDEIDANLAGGFLKRLNPILLLRPGNKITIQEDSGRTVTVKQGFFVMATANEKSKRYKGVEDLSVEFKNRFGANIIRINYPDHNVVYGQPPIENAIIARAALTDRTGNLVPGVSPEELERFVRACHVSQQVFSGNHGQGFQDYVSTERQADNKPGLDEAVLAPRTMVALLEKVKDSQGRTSLDQVLEHFVTGIKSVNDRKQMQEILRGYGFLNRSDDG